MYIKLEVGIENLKKNIAQKHIILCIAMHANVFDFYMLADQERIRDV